MASGTPRSRVTRTRDKRSLRRRPEPPILAFTGPSGAGKTRLLVRLLPALRRRGLRVCALKHSGHPHPFDRPGKDSDRLRRAGALAVVLEGPAGVAYFGAPLGSARAMVRLLPPCDLVVAEGFRAAGLPWIEIHRRSVSRRFLCRLDRRAVAVVSDEPPPRDLPHFGAEEIARLADFVAGWARGRSLATGGDGFAGSQRR